MYCPRVAAQACAGEGFVRVNAKPYSSDLTGANINVFVSVEGWYELLQATPDEVGRGKGLPVGPVPARGSSARSSTSMARSSPSTLPASTL
jgi:hypothetical protein